MRACVVVMDRLRLREVVRQVLPRRTGPRHVRIASTIFRRPWTGGLVPKLRRTCRHCTRTGSISANRTPYNPFDMEADPSPCLINERLGPMMCANSSYLRIGPRAL